MDRLNRFVDSIVQGAGWATGILIVLAIFRALGWA